MSQCGDSPLDDASREKITVEFSFYYYEGAMWTRAFPDLGDCRFTIDSVFTTTVANTQPGRIPEIFLMDREQNVRFRYGVMFPQETTALPDRVVWHGSLIKLMDRHGDKTLCFDDICQAKCQLSHPDHPVTLYMFSAEVTRFLGCVPQAAEPVVRPMDNGEPMTKPAARFVVD